MPLSTESQLILLQELVLAEAKERAKDHDELKRLVTVKHEEHDRKSKKHFSRLEKIISELEP